MPFQKTVNSYNPIGVEGDFATANPRASVIAGAGALVAGPNGVRVGKFAWVRPDGKTVDSYNNGGQIGFVHREQGLALITTYLTEFGVTIPAGFPVTLMDEGDFLTLNVSGVAAINGTAIYADNTNGNAVTGAAPTDATATGSIGSTFTATGAGTNLTTSAVTGLISLGDTIAGTGIPAGTTIVSQTSGTTGGAGVYVTSAATTIAATTATSYGNVLNVTAVGAGTLKVGDQISGTNIPANSAIASQVSGAAGGVGVYTISNPATAYAASTAITAAGGVLTNWVNRNIAAVGELLKISTWGKQ